MSKATAQVKKALLSMDNIESSELVSISGIIRTDNLPKIGNFSYILYKDGSEYYHFSLSLKAHNRDAIKAVLLDELQYRASVAPKVKRIKTSGIGLILNLKNG